MSLTGQLGTRDCRPGNIGLALAGGPPPVPAPLVAVASLTPAGGLTAGGALVTVAGHGFRVASVPAPALPTVLVLFGGAAATDVRVYSEALLTCLAPPATAAGRVAVTVVNLDDAGVPISGESVAVASAYGYSLPKYTREFECDFTRVVRALIQRMKQQLLVDEVNYAVQTDYDPTTGDELHVTKFAKLPAFALVGPELDENRPYSINEQPTFDDGTVSPEDGVSPGGFVETRVPYTVDVRFQIICASDNKVELLNLMSNFISFMHANKWLVVGRRAADPARGQVRIEMDFVPQGQPKNTSTPNSSNVVSWSANIVLRGLDIESFAGIVESADGLVPDQAVVGRGQTADEIRIEPAVSTEEATIVVS